MSKKRKKKKKNKLFLIIIVLLAISLAYYFLIYKKDINYKSKITIEVGEVVPTVKEYIDKEDLERVEDKIVWENLEAIENKIYKVGEYTGTISSNEKIITVTLVVEDTTAPIISGNKNVEMLAYEIEPNLLEGITASDNSGEDIKVTLEGEYNTKVPGEYILAYKAVDSSKNMAKKKFKLIVRENPNVKVSQTTKGKELKNYYGITYVDDILVVNKTYALPSGFAPNNLVSINGYIKVVDYVKDAFIELTSDAKSIGLNIYASSGYRSYNDQKYIYNNYVRVDGEENADTYSARAGHSEHQTGLAIDVNTVDSSFDGTNESNWLKENCYKYGFIIRYPKDKDSITGYMYEPWHIRYVGKDVAKILYNNDEWLTVEEYYGIDSKYK